jgi:hypothetical protein
MSRAKGIVWLVWGTLLMAGGWWLLFAWAAAEHESVLMHIQAPTNADFAVPVFAQFDVTQVIEMPQMARVSAIHVPLYLPAADTSLTIDLLHKGMLVQRWRYPFERVGEQREDAVFVRLSFIPARILDGMYEVRFRAPDIGHEEQGVAARVFVEAANHYYPAGYYRVAENVKEGDVGLTLLEVKRTDELVLERFTREPLHMTIRSGLWLAAGLVLVGWPALFFGGSPHSRGEQQ